MRAVHVVVPAHDEEETITRCLDSLALAADVLDRPVTITVVADACTDATVEIARAARVDVLPVDARCVGVARDAGVRRALDLAGGDPTEMWVAMTDADTTVPPDWLVSQLAAGADLVAGAAVPDPSTLPAAVLRAWWDRHTDHRLRIHGANLGFTGAAYLAAGGFPPLAEHEDVAFVEAAIAAGVRWTTDVACVQTSGRMQGRTPGGFAGYVRALTAEAS